jgi:hypothetical protein
MPLTNPLPLTSQADLLYHDGTRLQRLPKGTGEQVLKMNSTATAPEWGASGSVINWGGGGAAGHAPADSTNYYFSASFGFDPSTADATSGVIFPACRITQAFVTISVFGAPTPSTHRMSWFIRKNSTTETVLSTAVAVTVGVNTFSNSTFVPFEVAAGDRVYMKFVTPAWSTNPTTVFYGATLKVEFP